MEPNTDKWRENYYDKEYNRLTQDLLQLQLFIQEIPQFFKHRSIYEFEQGLQELAQQLRKLTKNMHDNLNDFYAHFEVMRSYSESFFETIKNGKYPK